MNKWLCEYHYECLESMIFKLNCVRVVFSVTEMKILVSRTTFQKQVRQTENISGGSNSQALKR
jgi:hypothetical protein